MQKRLAIATATRAEYGLLVPLIRSLMREETIDVNLIVSGTHLLYKYGYTIKQIEDDKIPISYTIPTLDENYVSDEQHVADAIARTVQGATGIFVKECYDALVVLGDRYELLGFCTAATICRLPIIHIHGGEVTEGAIDDKIRHAITKLSAIHFPSIKAYADRIIQMGENPAQVYTVGALGIDNIKRELLLAKDDLLKRLDIKTERPIAAVTYHPVTSEDPSHARLEIHEVLEALVETDVFSVITMPNSDVGGEQIYKEILAYVDAYKDRMVLRKSLGQVNYLSLMKCANIMVGNSSSGILESASFCLPTVDIGDRQKGRIAPENVIHCECQKGRIMDSIKKGMSIEFLKKLLGYENPYGDGNAAKRMTDIIRQIDFSQKSLLQKKFYDAE